MEKIIKKQVVRGHCLLSIPMEMAKKVAKTAYFRVAIDEGRIVYSPVAAED